MILRLVEECNLDDAIIVPHVSSHSPSRYVTLSLTLRHTLPHVTSHSPSRYLTLSLTLRHTLPHVTSHSPSRYVTLSLTLPHTLPHVTSHSPSRDVTLSLTLRHTLPHVTSHSPSRYVTLSLTLRHTLPHVTSHSPSRYLTLSLTLPHTLPHVTSHSPSRYLTLSLTWRHTLPHVTLLHRRRDKDLLDEKINNMTADMQAVSHKLIDQQDKITKLQTAATDNEMSRIKAEGLSNFDIFNFIWWYSSLPCDVSRHTFSRDVTLYHVSSHYLTWRHTISRDVTLSGQIRSANLALQQKSSELRTQSNKVELLTTENKHLQSSVSGLTGKVGVIYYFFFQLLVCFLPLILLKWGIFSWMPKRLPTISNRTSKF